MASPEDELIQINYPVMLRKRRCYECGHIWALESSTDGLCPCCSGRRNAALGNEIAALNKKVSALRGALTRAKRKAGGT